jgi:multidrug efflux pump subunit AcrB
VFRQPGGNIVHTIERVKALLPQLKAELPGDVAMVITADRSTTIRASLGDTEATLVVSVILVVLVVFLFLRDMRATVIPSITLSVSILGTFAVMYLLGYSLDNLSLMALTVATGFIVDDAIVVVENIARHVEQGQTRMAAALLGAREVSFTVLSMSLSLVAVFLPILLMDGLVGRLFQEFAIVLSISITISLVLSLTTAPMLCARLLRTRHYQPGPVSRTLERGFAATQTGYVRSLSWALRRPGLLVLILVSAVGLNVVLFAVVAKAFFPQQDGGMLMGGIQADQSISFQALQKKLAQAQAIAERDPAVQDVVGFTGGRGSNTANVFVSLKPRCKRDASALQVMVSLSAVFGYAGSPLSGLVSASNQLWTLAASGLQTLFDGGARRATVDAAHARYEQSVATYRQTVLTAFGGVEDQLSTLRILANEADAQQETVTLARQAAQITLDQYRAGTQAYTAVVTAQATQLAAEQSLLSIQQSRLVAEITLIQDLGGGWTMADLTGRPTEVTREGL